MIKYINIFRYLILIVAPLFCITMPMIGIIASLAVLWLSNYLDDIFFYLASKEVKNKSANEGELLSPINGIVTLVEKGVKFCNIEKNDVIKQDDGLSYRIDDLFNGRYDHVAVYLNKFSKHIVLNPSEVVSVYKHYSDGNLEMVSGADLVSNNIGEYMNNDSIIIEYKDFVMVLTMDKFISKYVLAQQPRDWFCLICRGSQCDFYFKENTFVYPRVGDCIDVYDVLAKVENARREYIVSDDVARIVDNAIRESGGFLGMAKDAWLKSVSTFNSASLMILVVIFPILFSLTPIQQVMSYVGFISIYLFVFVRFYRHMMYALMNVFGLKSWMQKSYNLINKVSLLWKK